jgi:hypothetical protein
MNTRRVALIASAFTVLFVITFVLLGFATGWLAIGNTQRPIGKLRPADLIVDASSSTPATETEAPDSSSSTSPLSGSETTAAHSEAAIESAPETTRPSIPASTVRHDPKHNDSDADD